MTRLLATLTVSILLASGFAQTRVACVGDAAVIGAYPAELQKLLGPKYDVREFGKPNATVSTGPPNQFLDSEEMRNAVAYGPDAVVVLLRGNGLVEKSLATIDSFEPALRETLERLRAASSHPKVYLWLFPDAEIMASESSVAAVHYISTIHPLAIQAAREAGASVIEKNVFGIELLTTSLPGAREAAQFVAEAIAPSTIKSHWRIARVSSFQADEGPPQNAIDGDPDTFWHSEYDPKLAKPPHEIVIDLGQSEWLTGFKYLPRQDGGTNGNVKDYEIYVGETPEAQTTLAAKGSFRGGRSQKVARFKASVKGRYVRFVCLSEENGQPFASAAELDVIRDPSKN